MLNRLTSSRTLHHANHFRKICGGTGSSQDTPIRHSSWTIILACSITSARNPKGSKTLIMTDKTSRLVGARSPVNTVGLILSKRKQNTKLSVVVCYLSPRIFSFSLESSCILVALDPSSGLAPNCSGTARLFETYPRSVNPPRR